MKTTPLTPGQRLRAWLTGHWLAIAGTALGCLGIYCLLPAPSPQAPLPPATVPLSRQQLRQATRQQASRLDSIEGEAQKLPALTQVRDRDLAAARRQNARATHLLTLFPHEALLPLPSPASAQSAERLARALAAYQPRTYVLDSTHSIR